MLAKKCAVFLQHHNVDTVSQGHIFGEHCNKNLSKAQYPRHKQLYFNEVSGTWSNGLATAASYAMPDPFSSTNSSEDEIMTEEQTRGKAFY